MEHLVGAMWNRHCSMQIKLYIFFFSICSMVRTYKRKAEEAKLKYSEEDMVRALLAVFKQAAAIYQVPKSSLSRRYHGKVRLPHKFGWKTALLKSEEFAIAQNLAALGDFGLAFDSEN